jgi:hypothetical protein
VTVYVAVVLIAVSPRSVWVRRVFQYGVGVH